MVKEKNGQIFSSEMLAWLISVVVGILLPLFTQDLIISSIANLSAMPETLANTTQTNTTVVTSALTLWGFFLAYATAIAFQIYFIAKTLRLLTVFALIVTMVAPITIWVALPYLWV